MRIRDHVSDQQIERFARGQATPEETREVVRHLLHGCAGCGQQVAAAFGLPRPAGGHDYSAVMKRSDRRLSARRQAFDEERQAAESQWDGLRQLAPAERAAAIRRGEGLETLAFFERLLEAGQASPPAGDPVSGEGDESEDIVQLALIVADRLTPTVSAQICADLRAEAWGAIADARRRKGDFEGAAAAMNAAWRHYEAGTEGLDGRALLLGYDASLQAAAGDLAAAERTLRAVAGIYRRLRDEPREGQALLAMAEAAGHQEPARGLALVEQALRVLRRAGDAGLLLRAHHDHAWFALEAGRCQEALERLDLARSLERAAGDDDSRFRRLWIEARLAFRTGNGGDAQILLSNLLELAQRRGKRKELVLVGLDLAAVHAASGDVDQGAEILGFLYPQLVEWRLHLDGLETWVELQHELALRRSDAQRMLHAAAHYYLRYWERPPQGGGSVLAR